MDTYKGTVSCGSFCFFFKLILNAVENQVPHLLMLLREGEGAGSWQNLLKIPYYFLLIFILGLF